MEKDPDLVALGKSISRLRRDAKLTQVELAEAAKTTENYLGEIERGERNPSAKMLFAIARALQVAPATLVLNIDQ